MATILLGFVVFHRSDYCCFLILMLSNSYLVQILKGLNHDPRPFHVSADIQAFDCSESYGNPSGHSAFSFGGFPGLFYLLFHSKIDETDTSFLKDKKWYWWVIWSIWLILTIFLTFSVPYSWYHLGVHSIDQILTGSFIGIWSVSFMIFVWKEPFQAHIINLLHKKTSVKGYIISVSTYIVVQTFLLVFPIICYFITESYF